MKNQFRTKFSEDIFNHKYRHEGCETWDKLAVVLVEDVCRDKLSKTEKNQLAKYITDMKFIPGGRYLYYAGRPFKAFNNCYLLRSEQDSREDWANLSWKAESCLMTGGGIGNDYSIYRPKNSVINKTGGLASGPVSKMKMINEIGREVMQGGSRRSAIYASLNWQHGDIHEFIHSKDWYSMKVAGTDFSLGDLKEKDFNFPAPLDMTNISVNYDTEWLEKYKKTGDVGSVFLENVKQALKTSEPGFSFNFYEKENETLRNAPVTGDTRVLTIYGYKKVKDIYNTKQVIWTGEQWAHDVVFQLTKKDSNLVKINLSNGRYIICSPEHPFIVKEFIGKGERKKIEFKRINAELLVPEQKIKSNLPIKDVQFEHDYNWYGLGFVFGDGSIKNKSGDISYHTDDKKECFEKASLLLDAHTVTKENRAYFKCEYESKGDILNKLEVLPYTFIGGWYDADGCYGRNSLRISNRDKDNLIKLQESLDYYGIKTVVREDGESSYKPGNIMYTLQVLNDSLLRFKEIIPTIRIQIDLDESYEPYRESEIRVVSVEHLDYTEDVYCCDVKVEEHSFMAEGVIISNCTEVTSEDDSDVCNLGSLNFAVIESKEELEEIIELSIKFLLCGTLIADLPYEKVYKVREKNRRLGLGLMGIHEWLLKRSYKYEVTPELHEWLYIYKNKSNYISRKFADKLNISRPVANRAIAPTGSIGILAGTSTGIEPIFAVAYKRRYLKGRTQWVYQNVIDGTAKIMIDQFGVDPNKIESAIDLASDYERRIKFQADVQDYVDMSISSTINLPAWGSELNNESQVVPFAKTLAKYAHRLRGFTCYADGSRGGQPITPISYSEAKENEGKEYEEIFTDICSVSGKGGHCGV